MPSRRMCLSLYRKHLLPSLVLFGLTCGAIVTSLIALSSIFWELSNEYYWKYALAYLILEIPGGAIVGLATALGSYVAYVVARAFHANEKVSVITAGIAALLVSSLLAFPIWRYFFLPDPAIPAAILNVLLISAGTTMTILWFPRRFSPTDAREGQASEREGD